MFEAGFAVTLGLSVIFAILYFKAKGRNDEMVREYAKMEAEISTLKEHQPNIIKATMGETSKMYAESFKSTTLAPMEAAITDLNQKVDGLGKQTAGSAAVSEGLMKETRIISDMLKSSGKRGRFGELNIERVFEMSGLTKGIHYKIQDVGEKGRPDFVVHISNDNPVIVDSKFPLDALWTANSEDDEAAKAKYLDMHVKAVKDHINKLAKKEYWSAYDFSLDLVIMVVPEFALLPALDRDTSLLDFAIEKRVILATPSTLMVMLKAVHLMWRQNEMGKAVREIGKLSKNLHDRMRVFATHYNESGKKLDDAVEAHNKGVQSWQRRLLPAAERLAEMGGTVKDIPDIDMADTKSSRMLSE